MDMGVVLVYYVFFFLFFICLVMFSIVGRLLGVDLNYYL